MLTELTETVVATFKSGASKLTGFVRRQFQAEVAQQYCGGSARKAERVFGWGREAVETGLNERRSGIRCVDNTKARGRHKTEEKTPELLEHIRAIVEPETQADPKFQTPLAFTRITAKAVREALAARMGPQPLPTERTVLNILNRMGYRLRRVRKTQPKKNSRDGRHIR